MDEAAWKNFKRTFKQELDPRIDAAVEQGDASTLVALYNQMWAMFPGDEEDTEKLKLILNTALAQMMRLGAYNDMARWFHRFARWYPEDDQERRFYEGVIEWHVGSKERARAIFSDLYEEFGTAGFGKDKIYVAVATGVTGEITSPEEKPPQESEVDSPEVQELAERINDLMDAEDYRSAIELCHQGLALLGNPRLADGAMWFFGTMGDALIELGDWQAARDAFFEATQSPGGIENPYIQLRLGQCEYELGYERPAANGLIAAYMMIPEIFEEEPPRYLQFLKDQGLI